MKLKRDRCQFVAAGVGAAVVVAARGSEFSQWSGLLEGWARAPLAAELSHGEIAQRVGVLDGFEANAFSEEVPISPHAPVYSSRSRRENPNKLIVLHLNCTRVRPTPQLAYRP
jgi:hypothetical protein